MAPIFSQSDDNSVRKKSEIRWVWRKDGWSRIL